MPSESESFGHLLALATRNRATECLLQGDSFVVIDLELFCLCSLPVYVYSCFFLLQQRLPRQKQKLLFLLIKVDFVFQKDQDSARILKLKLKVAQWGGGVPPPPPPKFFHSMQKRRKFGHFKKKFFRISF